MAWKIDLAKAYDRVDWRFLRLRQTLYDFCFPGRFVDLIINCVSSFDFSIVWNGTRFPAFNPKRRLRQGLKTPYLFVFV